MHRFTLSKLSHNQVKANNKILPLQKESYEVPHGLTFPLTLAHTRRVNNKGQ